MLQWIAAENKKRPVERRLCFFGDWRGIGTFGRRDYAEYLLRRLHESAYEDDRTHELRCEEVFARKLSALRERIGDERFNRVLDALVKRDKVLEDYALEFMP